MCEKEIILAPTHQTCSVNAVSCKTGETSLI